MDGKSWDVDLVRDLFNDRNHYCNFNTLIEDNMEEELYHWWMEKSGIYLLRKPIDFCRTKKVQGTRMITMIYWLGCGRLKLPPKRLVSGLESVNSYVPNFYSITTKASCSSKSFPVLQVWIWIHLSCVSNMFFRCSCFQVLDLNHYSSGVDDFVVWLKNVHRDGDKKKEATVITIYSSLWRA